MDGKTLSKMIKAGAKELEKNRDFVDSLNVFPVPDGDTGTNMSLTVLSAANEIKEIETSDIGYVAKSAAMGALKGARGNSGVILSQLFRGFSKALEGLTEASNEDIALALSQASQMAYKAVMKPKEGTILTMAREISERFSHEISNYDDLEQALKSTIMYGEKILKQTTEMLPQLKKAGVVDSGARGLLFVLEGAYKALNEDFVFETFAETKKYSPAQSVFETNDIEFTYEVLMDVEQISDDKFDEFKIFLGKIGDSLVVTNSDEFVRIHVHTNKPGQVIEKGLQFCNVFNARFENLQSQHENIVNNVQDSKSEVPEKDFGFVAVSNGSGFDELFLNLGADEIIPGGQSMNPSTEDILNAISKVNAKKIYVLPNNKNIILAAQQAKQLCENKEIFVVPAKTIPQGISVMVNFVPESTSDEQILQAVNSVKTAQVTCAVRDSNINDKKISCGDILGILEDEVVIADKDLNAVIHDLVDKLLEDGSEILTLYYGKDVQKDDAEKVLNSIAEKYPDAEIEIHNGNQPIYSYIISAE